MDVISEVGTVEAMEETYDWSISVYSLNSDALQSAQFSTHSTKSKWRIFLYPYGYDDDHEGFFSIYVQNCNAKNFIATVSLCLINRNDNEVATLKFEKHHFLPRQFYGSGKYIKRAIAMDPRIGIINNETLIIQFKIGLNPVNTSLKRKMGKLETDLQSKVRRLENLMNDKDFTDVSLVVNGRKFEAHKCVLAQASPVFEAMFRTNMKEKQLNEVIIEDIRPDIFEKLLRYAYVGHVTDIQPIAVELLAAADKYAMDELKLKCRKSLIDNLSVDRAVECLVIADRYFMGQLKAKVMQFITSHSADIVKDPSFKLLTDLPHLLYEVSVAIGIKK